MIFERLYHEQFSFVWRALRRLGVSEADLPDVLQEVFLVVHRRLPDFVARADVRAWLYRICFRAARDRRRKAYARREVLTSDPIEPIDEPCHSALDELERREDARRFEAALEHLDLEQRAVLSLFELEGMAGPDIAVALEIPLGTVYSRLRLARAAFRRAVRRQALPLEVSAARREEGHP